jgi:hypothetical protein
VRGLELAELGAEGGRLGGGVVEQLPAEPLVGAEQGGITEQFILNEQ